MNDTTKILIHTGNVLNVNELTRKAGQNTSEELAACLDLTLKQWVAQNSSSYTAPLNHVIVKNSSAKIPIDSRDEQKISVKVFVHHDDIPGLKTAVEQVCEELGTNVVEALILTFINAPDLQLGDIKEIWSAFEQFAKSGTALTLGISDISTETFIDLYNWAEIKPIIVQINISTCCVVPPALSQFVKEHNLQLLTHNDSPDLLPNDDLLKLIEKYKQLPVAECSKVKARWFFRYNVHVKCRGVLTSKGYVASIGID